MADSSHASIIAAELGISEEKVLDTGALLQEGCSVPFIARYRKEATGSLDEVAVLAIRDRFAQLEELDRRKAAVIRSLRERDLLTEELERAVAVAPNMTALEDIYLPFRPKRRTRASIALGKGLKGLADALVDAAAGERTDLDPLSEAARYIDGGKGVKSADDALAGYNCREGQRGQKGQGRTQGSLCSQRKAIVEGCQGQGRGRSEVQRLLRSRRASQIHSLTQDPGRLPRGERGLSHRIGKAAL
jgi:hypothetical protein